jgi:hypothetical protein
MPAPCSLPPARSEECWRNGETYVLMMAVVVYGYHALALLFGTAHCLGVVCGAQRRAPTRPACSPPPPCCRVSYEPPALATLPLDIGAALHLPCAGATGQPARIAPPACADPIPSLAQTSPLRTSSRAGASWRATCPAGRGATGPRGSWRRVPPSSAGLCRCAAAARALAARPCPCLAPPRRATRAWRRRCRGAGGGCAGAGSLGLEGAFGEGVGGECVCGGSTAGQAVGLSAAAGQAAFEGQAGRSSGSTTRHLCGAGLDLQCVDYVAASVQ